MEDINIDMGFFSISWKNADMWERLGDVNYIYKQMDIINAQIGKDVSILLDNVYPGESSYYTLQPSEHSVLIQKNANNSAAENRMWWFDKRDEQPNYDLYYILSSSQEVRLSQGTKLSARFSSGLVPIKDLKDSMWWFNNNRMAPMASNNNLSENDLKKIIDNIAQERYSTLIGRIAYGE